MVQAALAVVMIAASGAALALSLLTTAGRRPRALVPSVLMVVAMVFSPITGALPWAVALVVVPIALLVPERGRMTAATAHRALLSILVAGLLLAHGSMTMSAGHGMPGALPVVLGVGALACVGYCVRQVVRARRRASGEVALMTISVVAMTGMAFLA